MSLTYICRGRMDLRCREEVPAAGMKQHLTDGMPKVLEWEYSILMEQS